MSSPGSGSDISVQILQDLLHKLMTESRKVCAMFSCPSLGVHATVVGVIRRRASDESLWVMDLDDVIFGPKLSFNPFAAVVRKYGDNRAMGPVPDGLPRITSALTFLFNEGSTLGIFELAGDDEED